MNFRPLKYASQRGINRNPGECDVLTNTTPMRVAGAEVTRSGYSSSDDDVTTPTGVTSPIFKSVSTESPTAQEVLFCWGQLSGADAVHMKPYVKVGASTFSDEWVKLNETLAFSGGITIGTTTLTIIGADTKGFSSTANYYKGWSLKNITQTETAYVLSNSYSSAAGGTVVLTVIENIVPTIGLNWDAGNSYALYRWNHHNPTFAATYNFPVATVREGIFKICGGKGSDVGNKPLIAGYLKRTFFPGVTNSFTYQGTYVSERECPADSTIDLVVSSQTKDGSQTGLDTDKTYYVAIGTVYDGFQHGKLRKASGVHISSADQVLKMVMKVHAGMLNKRITEYGVYVAQDDGDTTLTGRNSPYFPVKKLSIIDSLQSAYWRFVGDGVGEDVTVQGFMPIFGTTFPSETCGIIDNVLWSNRDTQTWEDISGYQQDIDTIFSYDIEASVADRQWLGRVYRYTDGKEDLDRVYTNPRSSEGQIQPDIFADEPDIFTNRVLWGDSTFLTTLVQSKRGGLLALKNRAIVDIGLSENPDGTLNFIPTVVSTQHGCVSVNGAVNTEEGLFFAGYKDFFRYDGQTLKPLTLSDWFNDYNAISDANKESAIVWYRSNEFAVYVQMGTNQFVFFLATGDWRKVSYAVKMTNFTVKRDGTVLWTGTNGRLYAFDSSSTDDGTAIIAKFRTGKMDAKNIFNAENIFGLLDRVFINKNQVASSGTLDCKIHLTYDGVTTTKTFSGLTKSTNRLLLAMAVDDSKIYDTIDIEYNSNASPENGVVEFNKVEVLTSPLEKFVPA